MDEPWVWAIILLLAVLLFGSKRLPDAARGIGRSLRIFKAETKGLLTDDQQAPAAPVTPPQQIAAPAPVAPQAAVPTPAPVETPAPVAVPVTGADKPDPQ